MDDSGYDFNAPKYIDFATFHSTEDDETAEQYFDYDHENGVPLTLEESSSGSKTPGGDVFTTPQSEVKRVTRSATRAEQSKNNTDDDTPKARETRSARDKTPHTQEKMPAQNSVKKTKNNICSSLEEWQSKTAGSKTTQNSNKGKDAPKLERKPSIKRQHGSLDRAGKDVKRQKNETVQGQTPGKAKGLARANSFSTVRNRSVETGGPRKHQRGLSGDRTVRPRSGSSSSNTSEPDKQSKCLPITVPSTPTFMKRKPIKIQPAAAVKSSEEMEMDKIAYYRQELVKKRKQAQESLQKALTGQGAKAPMCSKELTRPEAFKFETDTRIKTHTMETRGDADVKDFTKLLRSDKSKPVHSVGPMKATRPEPFHLTEAKKRKIADSDGKQTEGYESMAQKVAAFTRTPDRFRSRPKAGQSVEKRGRSKSPSKITVPKTPNFETRTRSRPVHIPTREEMEQKEIEEAQKRQFKAHPVNHRILQNPGAGIKKVPSKPLTQPEEFHLSSNVKAHEREKHNTDEHYEFHAKPLNKKILEGPVGVKEAKRLPVTVPESPAFALKHRARIPIEEEPKETDKPNTRSRPAPHFGLPFQPSLHHKTTQPVPFTFEERDKKRAEMKAKKIEQVYEEEQQMRDFHANPLPDHEVHLPSKKAKPLTVQQPFNLDTDVRGAKKVAEWSKKMEEELREQKEWSKFHAREPTVLDQQPFIPQKENKHTTDISEFELNTAKRVMKREAFEMCKKARQDQKDNLRLQEERMREAEERAEMERIRREAVHKANPIKHYRQMVVTTSDKPLTMPVSPKFKTDTRLRTRASAHAESFMSA